MLVRLNAKDEESTAYLFGYLQSDAAYRQIASLAYGGSIPHFDAESISGVIVPLFDPKERQRISADVLSAMEARDDALTAELQARAMVEEAIERGAN
jgi:type I restriction enzyme S subunit